MSGKIFATFDGDSKRYHRFIIDAGQEVTGSIYVPKGQKVPGEIVLLLRSQRNAEKEEKKEGT